MSYELIWEKRGVVKRFYAIVTSDDMVHSVIETEQDPRFDDLRFVINDFLGMTSINASTDDVEKISAMDNGASFTNSRIKVAVVTTSAEVIALTNSYINSPLNKYPTKIFSSESDARKWIALT